MLLQTIKSQIFKSILSQITLIDCKSVDKVYLCADFETFIGNSEHSLKINQNNNEKRL